MVIQSYPGFHLILRPTNIWSTPGFIVIGRVNFYLVEIQASQCPLLLSGRNPRLQCSLPLSGPNPGFTMRYTIIMSNPGFMVSRTAIWSNPIFTIPHFLSGRNPGFRTNQVVIRSHPGFPLTVGFTSIWSNPGFLVTGWVNCYLVVIQASQCPLTLIWSQSRLHDISYHYLVKTQAS